MGKEIRAFFWTWKYIKLDLGSKKIVPISWSVRVATLYFQMWIRVVTRHRSVLEPPVAPARFSGRSYSSQVSLWRSSSRTFFTGQPTSDRSPSPHLTGPEIRVLGRVMGSPKKGFLFARLMFCLSFPIIVGSFCEGWRGSNTQLSSIVIT